MTGRRAAPAVPDELVVDRLDNGLTVVVAPDPTAARVAVVVHHPVGFRTERPDQAGMAHLFEHLAFQGSASLPGRSAHETIASMSGTTNGTTHQDYTDYYTVVPPDALAWALFAEGDRLRAPLFTPDTVAEQITGVLAEIAAATGGPHGGFPWPDVAPVLFDDPVDAHDGYGDARTLAGVTPADCVAFHREHYRPSTAVLTVAGAVEPAEVLRLAGQHLGDLVDPDGAVPRRPSRRTGRGGPDRWVHRRRAGAAQPAVALALVCPDPAEDLAASVAHLVLARLLRLERDSGVADATCGFFHPLDARGPEAVLAVGLLERGGSPERWADGIEARLRGWTGTPPAADAVDEAVRALRTELAAGDADLVTRGRRIGRDTVLFDDPRLGARTAGALRVVTRVDVARAAQALLEQPRSLLSVSDAEEPGARPWSALDPAAVPPAPPVPRSHPGGSSGAPRPAPRRSAATTPPATDGTLHELDGGHRLALAAGPSRELVEVRLRLELTDGGWADPDRVRREVRVLSAALGARAWCRRHGGHLGLRSDGQSLVLSGRVLAEHQEELAEVLARLPDAARGLDPALARGVRTDPPAPVELLDDAVTRHLSRTRPEHDGPGLLGDAVQRSRATLAVVGPADPALFTAALGRLGTRHPVAARGHGAPGPADPVHLAVPGGGRRAASWSVLSGATLADPARYVATAVVGGAHRSRLQARFATLPVVAMACFDTVAGHHRTTLRAVSAPGGPSSAELLGRVADECTELARRPVTRPEVDRVREHCGHQYLTAHDSPASLAELLLLGAHHGLGPEWLREGARDVLGLDWREVREAGHRLLDGHHLLTATLEEGGGPVSP